MPPKTDPAYQSLTDEWIFVWLGFIYIELKATMLVKLMDRLLQEGSIPRYEVFSTLISSDQCS